jgi:hypothetical protein
MDILRVEEGRTMVGDLIVGDLAGKGDNIPESAIVAQDSTASHMGIFLEPGVTLVGKGLIAIPNFSEEQVRFLDERRRLANQTHVFERVGGRSSRTPSGGARIS